MGIDAIQCDPQSKIVLVADLFQIMVNMAKGQSKAAIINGQEKLPHLSL
jgi:hypothetical protein